MHLFIKINKKMIFLTLFMQETAKKTNQKNLNKNNNIHKKIKIIKDKNNFNKMKIKLVKKVFIYPKKIYNNKNLFQTPLKNLIM